ncbi:MULTISPECIES: hypothetical protein [Ruminococcus]|jgi:hypothetical protein|uniref:Uncharacterized protein n=1 Tax=Ruminococcus flavefaciens TaxID=1265 RepID=A0A315XZB9_RUMFL|nr:MULTISPECIES: hypothetical protein [Ruminococcus]MBQ6169579.1 hypothetical protein [Ruminococcus sp.]MBR1431872.1 hypothetical protein [Ruminococcus sp.]PWJ13094.1 hypothetical protein IE37_01593 [Ruminococcus flavefaciens]SSA48700.1 hypothetical protein SAMN02910325_01593 [Ruminococcus flavefaciens]
MAWGNYEQNYVYNYDINAVLDAVMRAAAQVKLKLKSADRAAYRVKFSTGISLFTWGEEVYVTLGVLPDGKTGVNIRSSSNLGTEIAAKSRNESNVLKLVNALNFFLPPR